MIEKNTIISIQKLCNLEAKPISLIAEQLKIDLKSLYNFFSTKTAKALFFLEKVSGLVWIRTNPLNFLGSKLNLIPNKQNSGNPRMCNGRSYEELTGIKRACPERMEAILKLNRIKDFGYYNRDKHQFEYTNPIHTEIDSLFQDYLNRVKQEKIILTRAKNGNKIFAQDIAISYKTRYTDIQRQKQNIDDFNTMWKIASSKHLQGVFLTLTANPYSESSLWKTNQKMLQAWKPMNEYLKSILPGRVKWIKVNEFQKNGRLHFHIVFFGINWIAHGSQIAYKWRGLGGGKILDIHAIKQSPAGWIWARSCPSEAQGSAPSNLLGQYLQKSFSVKSGALYWATGCRTWTACKPLMDSLKKYKESITGESKQTRAPTKGFTLKGVLSTLTGFRSSHRRDSIQLFEDSQDSPQIKKPISPKKPKTQKQDLTFRTASHLSYQC